MPETGATYPVPSSADGSYIRPPSLQEKIAEKLRGMPRVDQNGRALPPATSDPSVVSVDPAAPAVPQGMAPNPLQGGGGVPVPAPPVGSTIDQLVAQTLQGNTPPLPEGYTPAPPR